MRDTRRDCGALAGPGHAQAAVSQARHPRRTGPLSPRPHRRHDQRALPPSPRRGDGRALDGSEEITKQDRQPSPWTPPRRHPNSAAMEPSDDSGAAFGSPPLPAGTPKPSDSQACRHKASRRPRAPQRRPTITELSPGRPVIFRSRSRKLSWTCPPATENGSAERRRQTAQETAAGARQESSGRVPPGVTGRIPWTIASPRGRVVTASRIRMAQARSAGLGCHPPLSNAACRSRTSVANCSISPGMCRPYGAAADAPILPRPQATATATATATTDGAVTLAPSHLPHKIGTLEPRHHSPPGPLPPPLPPK